MRGQALGMQSSYRLKIKTLDSADNQSSVQKIIKVQLRDGKHLSSAGVSAKVVKESKEKNAEVRDH